MQKTACFLKQRKIEEEGSKLKKKATPLILPIFTYLHSVEKREIHSH